MLWNPCTTVIDYNIAAINHYHSLILSKYDLFDSLLCWDFACSTPCLVGFLWGSLTLSKDMRIRLAEVPKVCE